MGTALTAFSFSAVGSSLTLAAQSASDKPLALILIGAIVVGIVSTVVWMSNQ